MRRLKRESQDLDIATNVEFKTNVWLCSLHTNLGCMSGGRRAVIAALCGGALSCVACVASFCGRCLLPTLRAWHAFVVHLSTGFPLATHTHLERTSIPRTLQVTYAELKSHYATSVVGLHTMWNEHFGIGVVEYMASGCIPLAHDSAGPRMDIVLPFNGQQTGFLASNAEEYATKLKTILVGRWKCSSPPPPPLVRGFANESRGQSVSRWMVVLRAPLLPSIDD